MLSYKTLTHKIEEKTILFGIFGLSPEGLSLAVDKARAGFTVLCFDLRPLRLDMIRRGVSYVSDIPSSDLKALVDARLIIPSSDLNRLTDLDFLALASPVDTPDPCYDLNRIAALISPHIPPGLIIIPLDPAQQQPLSAALTRHSLRPNRDFLWGFAK